MRAIILHFCILITCLGCKAQDTLKLNNLKYKGFVYEGTLNKSFINKRITFINGADSLIFNVKIAFDIKTKKIYDPGVFYNCKLKPDTVYSFILKRITPLNIPKEYNSYYRTNAVFDAKNKSAFKEIKKDTKYLFVGNSGMFIDINRVLFEITKMTPAGDCVFQH